MPYIHRDLREKLGLGGEADTAGELNYLITKFCLQYLASNGETYQTYNDIIGALEGCKLEFYARKVREYEQKKIFQNGDCY